MGQLQQVAIFVSQKVQPKNKKGKEKKRQKLVHKPDGQFHYCIAGDAAWYKQPPFPHLAAASGTETKKMSDYLDFNDT